MILALFSWTLEPPDGETGCSRRVLVATAVGEEEAQELRSLQTVT